MKKLLVLLIILIIAVCIGYIYVFHDHRDIQNEQADFSVNASQLIEEFMENQESSSKKYINKTVIVEGRLTEIEAHALLLNDAVYCTFDVDHTILGATLNFVYKIKGRCIGYDELIEVVKLDQASIQK